jgi:large subunit ribosomal protein L31
MGFQAAKPGHIVRFNSFVHLKFVCKDLPKIRETHPCNSGFGPYLCSPFKEKRRIDMKKGIHPEYRDVIFWDTSSDTKFLSRSTSNTKETAKWEDGKEYPVIKVEVSSASHPFFTGKKMFVDTAGRVEKFKNKYQKKA